MERTLKDDFFEIFEEVFEFLKGNLSISFIVFIAFIALFCIVGIISNQHEEEQRTEYISKAMTNDVNNLRISDIVINNETHEYIILTSVYTNSYHKISIHQSICHLPNCKYCKGK